MKMLRKRFRYFTADLLAVSNRLAIAQIMICLLPVLLAQFCYFLFYSLGYSFALMEMLPLIVVETLTAVALCKMTHVRMAELFERPRMGAGFHVGSVLAVVGATALGGMIYVLFVMAAEGAGVNLVTPDFSLPEVADQTDMVWNVIYGVVLAPIVEEILFRGFVLKSLERFGSMLAIVFSALLFAMMHLNLAQFPVALLSGLVLGYLTVKTRSILPAITAHLVNNALTYLPYEGMEVLNFAIELIGVIVFAVMIYKLLWSAQRWARSNTVLSTPKMTGVAMLAPMMIAYTVLYVVEICMFEIQF